MKTQLVSKQLLENEIEKYENNPKLIEENKFYYNLCKKERLLMQKLNVDISYLFGTIEEVEKNIKNKNFYLINPEEFQEMQDKVRKYDEIINFINRQDSPIY